MDKLPFEVIQKIFDKLDTLSKLKSRGICKDYQSLQITDLSEFDDKLTNDIILQYPYLEVLDANYNVMITDKSVKTLSYLRILHIVRNNWVTDESLMNKKYLVQLYASYNNNITDYGINQLPHLEILNVHGNTSVTDSSVSKLSCLRELYTNDIITSECINQLPNLRLLRHGTKELTLDKGNNLEKIKKFLNPPKLPIY